MATDKGFFQYKDIAVGAGEAAAYTAELFPLQNGASADDLKGDGVQPYDFASLELDAYITSRPKPLAQNEPLGYVPAVVSNSDGTMPTNENGNPPVLTIAFQEDGKNVSLETFGITIHAGSVLKHVKVRVISFMRVYEDIDVYPNKNDVFIPWSARATIGAFIYFFEIDQPGHFLKVYSIEFGRTIDFDESKLISAEIHSTFPMLCDVIEYDTLNLHVLYDQQSGFFFQRRQPLNYMNADGSLNRTYYLDVGETVETAQGLDAFSAKLSAYDSISNLEGTFLGGMYESISIQSLLSSILQDVPFEVQGADTMTVSGYIPITTRREALALVCRGTNLRPYRGAKMTIKPLELEQSEVYAEGEIVEAPSITTKQDVAIVNLDIHHYSKGTEEKELYHWYISTTREVIITWSEPVWTVKAYEVTGEDENGNDIVSDTESAAVTFVETNANYAIIKNTSLNKIVLKGLLYVESTETISSSDDITAARDDDMNQEVKDQTMLADGMETDVLNTLAELYRRSTSFSGQIVDAPAPYPGEAVEVLGTIRTVTSVKDTLTGLYEMEAT